MCKPLQQLNTLNNLMDLLEHMPKHVPYKNWVRKLDLFSCEERGMSGDIMGILLLISST